MQVVGNNISSAGSPDYTRLSPDLNPLQGQLLTRDLQPGAGVALTAIQRNIDEALEDRIRQATGASASASTQEAAMAQIETLFDDLTGTGVMSRLTQFFGSFEELQNRPEDIAIRDLVITDGVQLAESLSQLRSQLVSFSGDVNDQIGALVSTADGLARDIGRLNNEIARAEGGRTGEATGLRDQRDALLRDLSELFDVSVREQPNGTTNVYVGNEALIQGGAVRGLTAVEQIVDGTVSTSVRFEDSNQQVTIRGGRLEGLMITRDQNAQIAKIDQLASALIADVNRIHADGQGLTAFTSVTGETDLLVTDAPLDADRAGLSVTPRNGSFYITVADDVTATPVSYRVDVDLDGTDAGTTLQSLVESINEQVTGVTASITGDNRLKFVADEGRTFTFGYDGQEARPDTSGVLAALGINTFFSGTDASNIAINGTLLEDPSKLAAAEVFLTGDGATAANIAALIGRPSETLGASSLSEFYRTIANNVAITGASVRENTEATGSVLASLSAQRESISGVNLDEEAIALVKYERAFQGASRFVRVVDDLLTELVSLVR